MFRLSLADGHGIGTLIIVLLIAMLLTALFYYRAFGNLSRGRWSLLLALRWIAIIVVVLLLFRPTLNYYKDLEDRRSVVFVVDTSASMSITDDAGGRTRLAQAQEHVGHWWEQLAPSFNLHLIEFSERARHLEDGSRVTTLSPEGKSTSLSRGLTSALNVLHDGERVPPDEIEAVFLLSDGVHNTAGTPEDVAQRMSAPVYAIGVGASLKNDISYRDVKLTGLNCADTLMLNNKARITASVEGVGVPGRVARVILEQDGEPVDEVELILDETDGAQEVEFEFRPEEKGRHTYTVRIPPLAEEKIEENNERTAIALVVEPGIRVLYIEGTLRQEYGAISERFLSKDPDLEFCALIQTRPNVFLCRTNIEGLTLDSIPNDQETIDMFDVFIIGDLDSSYIKPPQQEMILNRVRSGAGLVMLGGYHALGPGGHEGTAIGDALPALLGDREIGQVTDEFLPKLTPDGARSPIFANIAGFFPTRAGEAKVGGLPALSGCTRVLGQRPGATVLATCPLEMTIAGQEMPVLLVQPFGEGRTAVFACDTTRVWQQGPRALGQESPFLRFWGQFARYLAGRAEEVSREAGVTASTDKGYYEPEEPIVIAAIVRDEQGEGATAAKTFAEIKTPDGRTDKLDLAMVPGADGHYSASYEPDASGAYEINVGAELGELTLAAEMLEVEVGRANMEFDVLDLDEQQLGLIAANSGGRYAHISTADHLIDALDRSERKRRVFFERELAPPLPLWIVFVSCVSIEWALRRRFRLR